MDGLRGGIRVPLVVRDPLGPEGETRTGFALNNDLAPTFADWAGMELRTTVDGRSLSLLLPSEAAGAWRDAFLVEAIRSNEAVLPDRPSRR